MTSNCQHTLELIAVGPISKGFFDLFHSTVLDFTQALQRRLQLLGTILSKEPANLLDIPNRSLIENAFPNLLITENQEKLSLIDDHSMEYRANSPLKLGEDITMIATDSLAHQKIVQDYLHANKLDSVSVVTFDELQLVPAKPAAPRPLKGGSLETTLLERLSLFRRETESTSTEKALATLPASDSSAKNTSMMANPFN